MNTFNSLFVQLAFHPLACVHEGLYPWGNLVGATPCGVRSVLPGEDGALWMRHHGKVSAVGRAYTGHVIVGPIGVTGVLCVVILGHYVVTILWFRQVEAALSVGYPY